MKLKRFKEKNNKRTSIILFTITCILLVSGVILYRTFAIFEVKTNQNVIKGTVQDPGNIYFAFYKDSEIQKDMPSIGEGYVLDEEASYCGVTGSNDNDITVSLTENYTILVHGVTTSRTKCNLYFVKGNFIQGKGIPIVEKDDGLYEVKHEDYTGEEAGWKNTEYRFAGSNPNNYITFNEELWRIIGLVNVKTSDETIEQRLKIIKNTPLEENKSWDDNNSNDWTKSSTMEYLNGEYYNKLKDNTKSMIDENITWNIGSNGIYESTVVSEYYVRERGTETYNSQPSEWKKEEENNFHSIGLIYPSDYGWATSGGSERQECLSKSIFNWSSTSCASSDWLIDDNIWTMTSYKDANSVFLLSSFGHIYSTIPNDPANVFPVLYLKSNVKILNDGQEGNKEKPFHLISIS